MNRSRIEWCDHTLNIVTGCRRGCEYCYARTMSLRFSGNVRLNITRTDKYRKDEGGYILDEPFIGENGKQIIYPFGFEPTLHRYRFNTLDKLKMGQNIFVGAMADLFGDWIPDSWIDEVFRCCAAHDQHNYLFLTKNPERYADLEDLPAGENMFYGVTITTEEEMHRFNFLPARRNTFVSIEPILEDVLPEKHNLLFRQTDWVIIGAETGRRKGKVIPDPEWIQKIAKVAEQEKTPVFMKDSLIDIVGEDAMKREFPDQLLVRKKSDKILAKLMGECVECHERKEKNKMVSITARTKRGGKTNAFAYMCKPCFVKWCKEHGVNVPPLEGLEEK